MKCPKCQHESSAEAKFCERCGVPLGRVCAYCGSEVSFTAKFCSQCGHSLESFANLPRFGSPKPYTPRHLADKILGSRVDLEGERKQVTVLFADMKGSTELLSDLDPEDAQKLLDPVLERMIEGVHRYEGAVNSVMGDGIMALFGAPLAHEDHAIRACYAALRMQQTIAQYSDEVQRSHGVPITIRVGLNSGEIVVRAISNDLHMDYTVVGQTLHLAARMEQIARPGSTLMTVNTFKLAEGYVVVRSLGPVPVKGISDPVQVFELTGAGAARTRLQAAVGRGLTRFIGRSVEMADLSRALELACNGRGQIMAIVGEAGVGKSRLVHEFVHSHQPENCLILQASSISYGRATPYLPVIELLKQYFKINVHDSTRSIREKVSGKILTLDASLLDAIPPVLDLLEALDPEHPFRSLDPLQHRQSTYQAVTRLLLSESRVQPLIVIFEDLHWNDLLSLGLLDALVVGALEARLLLLVSYRPGYKDEWVNRPNYRQLQLKPFAGDDLTELLQVLLGSDTNLTTLKLLVMERASGNPFFAEEIVRGLADSGVLEGTRGKYQLAKPPSSVEVPPTVQAVLATRIDALPAPEKRLLQEAAVIGHDIPLSLLHAICGLTEDELGGLLGRLQDAEFLYAVQLFPELQYRFKHSFTHDVTYSGVLRERRRDIHARTLNAMERLYADRLGEHVEQLAHHAVHGELKQKAVHYLRQAGRKAAARMALADARIWLNQALDILKKLPKSSAQMEQAFEISLELRALLRQLGEGRQMLEHLHEAEIIAEELKDDRRRGLVCAFMTTVQATLGELDEALANGSRALEIAERFDDAKLRIIATSHLEQTHYYRGDYEDAIELARKNLAQLPPDWLHEYFGMSVPASIFDRAWLIMSLAELGRFSDAAKYEAEVIRIAEPTKHAFTIGWAHFASTMPPFLKGDWVTACSRVGHWITMIRTGNAGIHLPWAIAASAWAMAQIGETGEAQECIAEAEPLLERQATRGIVGHRCWAYQAVSRACLLLDRTDDALRLAKCALEASQQQSGFAAHAQHLLADIASSSRRFDPENAIGHYQEALELAQQHGMRPIAAHCHFGLGTVYHRIDNPEHARENLMIAATMYRDMDMGYWLAQCDARSDLFQQMKLHRE